MEAWEKEIKDVKKYSKQHLMNNFKVVLMFMVYNYILIILTCCSLFLFYKSIQESNNLAIVFFVLNDILNIIVCLNETLLIRSYYDDSSRIDLYHDNTINEINKHSQKNILLLKTIQTIFAVAYGGYTINVCVVILILMLMQDIYMMNA